MTYPEFETRWKTSGGAELSNYGLFIQDLCDLLGVPRPDPKTDNPAHDAYVLERAVQFNDGGKKSTGRIDLYKRGCFILETKQGVNGFVEVLTTLKKRAARDLPQDLRTSGPQDLRTSGPQDLRTSGPQA
ncbi:hypothetical protein H8B15_20750 [Hymenobacter sp. BT507]|uniref:MmeI-like N-terminal domain-containing protein n=1 Tax=Hymenobacter citatus TaxID=2763506 RepID=A0ABR7MS59_9BACT|nr:type IIL restriction-modification enzyme MmeI [Hymenobacter citatus]MBC6613363.1 hypothetical protein [Hymenobacter citatus]